MAKGSVILTHLIDGDPQGIRRVTMKNKTCEMLQYMTIYNWLIISRK